MILRAVGHVRPALDSMQVLLTNRRWLPSTVSRRSELSACLLLKYPLRHVSSPRTYSVRLREEIVAMLHLAATTFPSSLSAGLLFEVHATALDYENTTLLQGAHPR